MFHSIINPLNLKDEDIDSIDSNSSFQNEFTHKIFITYNSIIYYNKRRYHRTNCGKYFYENNLFSVSH